MKCLLCGGNKLEILKINYNYETDVFEKAFPNLLVVKCLECNLVQADIEKNEDNFQKLYKYYLQTYRSEGTSWGKSQNLGNKKSLFYQRGEGISDLLRKHYSEKDIVVFEKGCGYGFNLMKIREKFPHATLYSDEMDEHAKPYLEHIGVIKCCEIAEKKYDIIIMSHVLEHLLNPDETIQECCTQLKENGLLYIEVPNSMNFVEPHITFWNPATFIQYYNKKLKRKLKLLECYTTGYPIYQKNIFYKKLYELEKKFVPAIKKVNKKTINGVYLRILLKKQNVTEENSNV